jgi:hypothetical protein
MARGWESKAVESQQQDASAAATAPRRALTPEQRDQARRRLTLEMALADAAAELRAACRPAHREMLRLKLEAIRVELERV